MEWAKKNLVLVVGIAMPLLLAVFFAVSLKMSEINVAAPKHKLLFSEGDYNPSDTTYRRVRIDVENAHLKATALAKNDKNSYNGSITLYLYDPVTGSVQNIVISAEDKKEGEDITPPELASLKLNSSPVSPDGYTLIGGYNNGYYSGGIFTELFYSGNRNRCYLKKESYKKRIEGVSCYSPKPVAWVME